MISPVSVGGGGRNGKRYLATRFQLSFSLNFSWERTPAFETGGGGRTDPTPGTSAGGATVSLCLSTTADSEREKRKWLRGLLSAASGFALTQPWQRKCAESLPSLVRTVMGIPGSLSLMKGPPSSAPSPSRASRMFLAQTKPCTSFLSSCRHTFRWGAVSGKSFSSDSACPAGRSDGMSMAAPGPRLHSEHISTVRLLLRAKNKTVCTQTAEFSNNFLLVTIKFALFSDQNFTRLRNSL